VIGAEREVGRRNRKGGSGLQNYWRIGKRDNGDGNKETLKKETKA